MCAGQVAAEHGDLQQVGRKRPAKDAWSGARRIDAVERCDLGEGENRLGPCIRSSARGHIGWRARRCRRSNPLRRRTSSESCAVRTDAVREPGKPGARTRDIWRPHGPRRRGDGRGLPVSRGGLFEDQLLKRQIRDRASEPRVLTLQLLQSLDLIVLQPAVFGSPSVVRYFRHAYRPDRLRHRATLRRQNVNLPQLRDNLLRRVPLPGHSNLLLLARSHTSGRTTFQGADHVHLNAESSSRSQHKRPRLRFVAPSLLRVYRNYIRARESMLRRIRASLFENAGYVPNV